MNEVEVIESVVRFLRPKLDSMEGSFGSSDNDDGADERYVDGGAPTSNSTAAEECAEENRLQRPELFDTSSLTRRLARGEYTQSIARKITEQEEIGVMLPSAASEASFEPCARGDSEISASVNRELFEEIGDDRSGPNQSALSSELSSVNIPPQTPVRQPQSVEVPSSTNSTKSALDSFSEYISFFFKNAENYEEMLERNESQNDLKVLADGKRRESRFASPEQQAGDVVNITGERASSPNLILSDSQEAMAAVEAMCNFRSLREVKKEIMDRGTPKKQKIGDSSSGEEADADIDIRQSWDSFTAEKKSNKFNELGLESIALPCSVDDFYKHVLDDNAQHSIEKFMLDIGELSVEATSWQPSNTNSTDPTHRTIKYIHPINAPMAPPTAGARKEQTLHKFGTIGLCLETSTYVEDVPMADCFIVRDRLWVSKNPEEENGCIVSITFQIDFIKGTMFRRIIENTTTSEYKKYWTQFWEMTKSNLGSTTTELDEVAIELEEATLLLESEGQEVPLSSVLGRIRSSSRRLSVVAKRASVRNINSTTEKTGSSIIFVIVGKGKAIMLEMFTIVKQHVKEHFAEKDDFYVLGCILLVLLVTFNVMALWQINTLNKSINMLTKQISEEILTNMGGGESCVGAL